MRCPNDSTADTRKVAGELEQPIGIDAHAATPALVWSETNQSW